MIWIYEGAPLEAGWFPVLVCWDENDGVFPRAAYFDGKRWEGRIPLAFGDKCDSKDAASLAARENDPDTPAVPADGEIREFADLEREGASTRGHKLSTELVRQHLDEQVPGFGVVTSEALGTSLAAFYEQVGDGKVTAERALAALAQFAIKKQLDAKKQTVTHDAERSLTTTGDGRSVTVALDNNELLELATRLKCGEYDGVDVMHARLAIDELIALREWCAAKPAARVKSN